jgi:hypothetical protein
MPSSRRSGPETWTCRIPEDRIRRAVQDRRSIAAVRDLVAVRRAPHLLSQGGGGV